MIRWFLLQNRAGRTRLAKYYVPVDDDAKRRTEYDVFKTLSSRENKWSNIAEVRVLRQQHVTSLPTWQACRLYRLPHLKISSNSCIIKHNVVMSLADRFGHAMFTLFAS